MDEFPKLKIAGIIILVCTPFIFFATRDKFIIYDGDIESVRFVVQQVAEDVNKLTAKHAQLKNEMSHLSDCILSSCSSDPDDTESVDVTSKRLPYYEYSYDRHMKDFALESAGARIIDTGGTVEHVLHDSSVSRILYAISSALCSGCDGARTMLQPGSLPGECWSFKGSRGEAVIQLLGNISVTGVAMEHISAEISPTGDISSAPRLFQLEGLDDSTRRAHDFGTFEYNRQGRPIQYFKVESPANCYFNLVRVRILSNWGHPVYTCVYRVRVHGDLSSGKGYIAGGKVAEDAVFNELL